MDILPEAYAYVIARIALGTLFFFQAYDKIFRIGLEKVYDEVLHGTRERKIPDAFSKFSVYLSSWLELLGGLLLITGLFTLPVLYIMGIHLILIITAFGFLKGVWDMKHVWPRLALLILLLLLPQEWNCWSAEVCF